MAQRYHQGPRLFLICCLAHLGVLAFFAWSFCLMVSRWLLQLQLSHLKHPCSKQDEGMGLFSLSASFDQKANFFPECSPAISL